MRAYRHGFVPEEIDALVAVLLHVSQAVPLVPSVGEDVDADLASCGAGNTDAEGRGQATGRPRKSVHGLGSGWTAEVRLEYPRVPLMLLRDTF